MYIVEILEITISFCKRKTLRKTQLQTPLANFPQTTKSPTWIFFFQIKKQKLSPFVMSQKARSGCSAALGHVLMFKSSIKFGLVDSEVTPEPEIMSWQY